VKVIYQTTVTAIGPLASQFAEEKMLVLFKENAPEELAEFCILHGENDLKETIREGDILSLDGRTYSVTAVGRTVNENLESLGHITLKFTGEEEADLPGTLVLEDHEVQQLQVGSWIQVLRK
jgi:glucitol/sorbitol PTS system EIIA component